MSEAAALQERLDSLKNGSARAQKPRRWLLASLAGSVGLLAGVYITYLALQDPGIQSTLLPKTSEPSEYQQIRAQDFATLETTTDVTTNDDVERLNALVTDLRARLTELANNPVTVVETDPAAELALERLQEEMATLEAAIQTRNSAFNAMIVDRDALQMQVDALENQISKAALGQSQQNDRDRLLADEERQRQEQQRQQALDQERKLADQQALLSAQINSPMVALRSSSQVSGTVEDANARYSGDDAFIRAGADATQATRAAIIANPSNTIIQGTFVTAALETAISSDLRGNIAAVVSYDVYSMDMARVLIPRGSKLFGRYSSDISFGQKRVLIAWDRLVTTDHQSVQLDAFGSDRLGRSGLTGRVDTHFLERFGSAAAVSLIGLAPALMAESANSELSAEAVSKVGDDFASAMGGVMADYLSLKPTIHVDQGAVVTVVINQDIELF